ncbi:DNA excision repair protein ERCC-6-like 2 [Rhynchocyon petersi]
MFSKHLNQRLAYSKHSVNTLNTYRWCPGERCLAPSPDGKKLCEASIKSVTVDENGNPFAIVLYSDSLEKKVPLRRLQEVKSVKDCSKNFIFDDEDLEKPYFSEQKCPSSAITFKLSEDGDCIPYTINRYLRDYQREGVQFLYGHYNQGRGCILGDDMGLGKTVQVISFLAAVLHKKGTREDIENNMPEFLLRTMQKDTQSGTVKKMFLIVAPLSVLYNWRDELDTWGYFKVSVLHGNKKDNELVRIKQRKCEVALTTYETLRLCLDELNSIEWSAIIVDEVHRIKNPKARVTKVMKALKCSVRIGLTGTILQNNMKELWCVMDWAVPGVLGSRIHFKKQFSDPVEHGQRHTATKRELATGRKIMHRLARKISGWFLRRTKTLIKDQLPKKEDRMVYCSLTDFQKAVYQTVLETEDITWILRSSEPCTCSSGRKRRHCCYKINSQGETVKTLYFSYLSVLQKVANHVALLQTVGTSEQQKTLISRICDQVFSRFPEFVQKSKDAAFETISDPKYSGKMKVLQKLLSHCRKNKDKVLLFSFSTKLLDVLQQYCVAAGLDFRRLDGNTKSEERIKIVKEFNSTQDVNICLVSTMAGGLGLNFVGANVIILFDPTWNPANDLQAIDRAYRIGQTRDVKVFRLISVGTVEEIMYLRQVYKQQLHCVVVGSENAKRYFEAVQGSKEHQGELFGIHNLFKLRSQGSCLTRDILEREGKVEAGIMTATTWWKEGPPAQKLEMSRELNSQEAPGQREETVRGEACDYCSDFSDEEPVGNSRIKTTKSKASYSCRPSGFPGQLSLLHCGFSKLFETKYKAVEVSDGIDNSQGESLHKQPICRSTKAKDDKIFACEKSWDSVGYVEHQTKASIINANEKFVFVKSETLKPMISSESDDEKKFKNVIEHQDLSESEDSDIIFPTQDIMQRLPKCSVRFKPPLDGSEDFDAGNITQLRHNNNDRGNEQVLNKLNLKSSTLKSVKRKDTSDISDESDDIEIAFKSRIKKQRATISLKPKKEKAIKSKLYYFPKGDQVLIKSEDFSSQAIDEFSSSDVDLNIRHISSPIKSHGPKIMKEKISFSSRLPHHSKKRSTSVPRKQGHFSEGMIVSQEQTYESVDKFLDGVQEVAYVHSNQSVIGSSKAENHMSRWAAWDVFELRQFSQLPANIAVCNSKRYQEKIKSDTLTQTEKSQLPDEVVLSSSFRVSYPISQKKKKVHHTDQTTFIIGETPKGIQRKQFEEMASFFTVSSIEEFAEHITNATSEERQKMLKDFYASQYPEIQDFFVASASELHNSAHGKEEKVWNKSAKGESLVREALSYSEALSCKDSTSKVAQDCRPKLHKVKAIQFQTYDVCGEEAFSNDGETKKLLISSTQEIGNGIKCQLSKDTTASCSPNCKVESYERKSENTKKDQKDLTKMSAPRNGPPFTSDTNKTSVGALLGDTSILDDLFKSHEDSLTQLPKKVLPGPMEKAKQRPKDFWDMLNEQNDSLSKLTDLSVIETLCEKVPLAASSKRKEELETSLWKSNERFLWKKINSNNTDGNTASM